MGPRSWGPCMLKIYLVKLKNPSIKATFSANGSKVTIGFRLQVGSGHLCGFSGKGKDLGFRGLGFR